MEESVKSLDRYIRDIIELSKSVVNDIDFLNVREIYIQKYPDKDISASIDIMLKDGSHKTITIAGINNKGNAVGIIKDEARIFEL